MGNVISLDPLIKRVCDSVLHFGWEFGVKHVAYVYHLQDNLQSLEKSLEDLQMLSEELIRRIEERQRYLTQRSEKVNLWIKRVEKNIAIGYLLKTEGELQVDRLCLAGICSTHYCSTSVFGGQVEKCVKELNDLKTEGEGFTDEDLVVDAAPKLNQGAKMPCDPVGLEAKLEEVLTLIHEKNAGIVGVYGQGGVGKTTLLKEINNHYVRRSENFLVVWIDVPKDVNVEAIQQAIGKNIGLPDELKVDKAEHIFKALQQKKIILLLDDISKAIELSKIGIPPSNSLNESKVLFTTRFEHACRKMAPGRSIGIETLGDEQAWQLFEKRVGKDIIDSHPQIPQLARRVAKKCGGLPLALCIIGEAMSCAREPNVWEQTIKTFERPYLLHLRDHQDGDMSELFSILRYGYDSLPNETYKSCFLYCALFPEAYKIDKDIIKENWVFEDFWINCNDDDINPRYEASRILNFLVGSCLLEDVKDYVKMHDVVRSMALWIGKEDTWSMAGLELEEAPSVRKCEQMKRVSLMKSDIKELTQVPACPNLLTLLLSHNIQLNKICSGFFESMGMLTVLDLSNTSVEELPESISRLVSLKYLNISHSKITKLPAGLIELKELRYLNLNGLPRVRLSRKNQIICHLSSLQVLGMLCSHSYEEDEMSDGEGDDEILLEELQVLKNLKVLGISLHSFSGLMKLFNNRGFLKKTRWLSLNKFIAPGQSINISMLAQSKHLDWLGITDCDFKELKNIEYSTDATSSSKHLKSTSTLTQMISFDSITQLTVKGCHDLKDVTCVVSMPKLRWLYVCNCWELREIISREKIGEEVHPIFSSLAILRLHNLPMLNSIYPSNTLTLRFLYDLCVEKCPQLKKLPFDPNSSSVLGCSQIDLIAEEKWWDAVEWEDDATKAALLPSFNIKYFI